MGVIVSPYNQRYPDICSEITCLTISDDFQMQLKCSKYTLSMFIIINGI